MGEKISRREQKKLYSRSAILEAAVREFSQKGFQETSIADIMNAADLGIGTFYNYFESKEELLMQLLNHLVGGLEHELALLQQEKKPSGEVLSVMLQHTSALLAQNRFVLPLFLSAADRAGMPEQAAVHPANVPSFKKMFCQIMDFKEDSMLGIPYILVSSLKI